MWHVNTAVKRCSELTISSLDSGLSCLGLKAGQGLWILASYQRTASGRGGGLMVSALDSGSNGPSLSLGWALCCVLGQDTSLSQCLFPPRCITGYWLNTAGW